MYYGIVKIANFENIYKFVRRGRGRPREIWRRTVERERQEYGFKVWLDASILVLRTEKLGERERKALFPLLGKGHDDDDER